MQIVISVPEEMYKQFNVDCIYYPSDGKYLLMAVKRGMSLPKGHGRLIDADMLMNYCQNQKVKTVDCNDIARFPTIIEADEEDEDADSG